MLLINRNDRTYRTYILGALGALGILGLVLIGVIGEIRETREIGVIGEIRGRVERIGVGIRERIWGVKVRMQSSRKEEKELRREKDVLEFKLARLELENEALRKQLEAPLPPDLDLIPARVVGYSRFLYIDKGKRDGVKKEDAVIAEEIFVGQVAEVGEKSAKIRLLSDPESKIPVRTMRGALGLVVGGEEKNLRLEKVLQREELKEGDLVATSGDSDVTSEGGGEFPADLLIGRVDGLLESKKEVYKQANVKPGIEYDRLLYVFVVR